MNILGERLGAGGLDRRQSVGEHRGEKFDELPVAVVGAGELAEYRRGPREPSPFIADIPDEAKATVKASCDRALRPHLSHEKAAALRPLGARLSSF